MKHQSSIHEAVKAVNWRERGGAMGLAKPNTPAEVSDIQRQMAQIRHDMHQEVQGAVKDAQSLTNWRNLIKSHPWPALLLASVAGYLIVPKRRANTPVVLAPASADREMAATISHEKQAATSRSRSTGLGTVFALLAPIVIRAGQNYALSYLEAWLAQHPLPPAERGTGDRRAAMQGDGKQYEPSSRVREYR
jgi:hypothetical protein